MNLHRAKRVVKTPVIQYGRRKFSDVSPNERERLERHAYRKSARQLWANMAVDPHFLYRADLDKDSVIVDVGAFRGHVAQELYDLYHCRVYAYEPFLEFYDDVVERFEGNDLVTAFPYGLGKADATLTMQVDGQASTVTAGVIESAGVVHLGETETVELRDVAAVLDELGHDQIDFLKLNIEGGEFDVLDRIFETGWNHRIRYFLIQFHEWYDNADWRRLQSRHRLRTTHDQVWNHPWIYELWCSKALPHPAPVQYSKAELEKIRQELKAQRDEREARQRNGS